MTQIAKKPLTLGHVSGVFGVKGWIKVHSYTEPREAILDYRNWLVSQGENWQSLRLEEGKKHGKTVIARLEGVTDRDTAASLIELDIAVARDDMPGLGEREFYWADLEGLQVHHIDGRNLGEVSHLLATGANDVLVVRGEKEILIPYVWDKVIRDVDLEKRLINVDWEWD